LLSGSLSDGRQLAAILVERFENNILSEEQRLGDACGNRHSRCVRRHFEQELLPIVLVHSGSSPIWPRFATARRPKSVSGAATTKGWKAKDLAAAF
jgi:hypothetical protein